MNSLVTKQKSFRKTWRFNLDEETFIKKSIIGASMNVCCGQSTFGNIRVDLDDKHNPDWICDYFELPKIIPQCYIDTVIFDPPFQDYWKHGLKHAVNNVGKIASKRFIIKGYWFVPRIKGFDWPNIEIFYKPNKRLMIVQVYDRIKEDLSAFV